jgi:hypothetical protein
LEDLCVCLMIILKLILKERAGSVTTAMNIWVHNRQGIFFWTAEWLSALKKEFDPGSYLKSSKLGDCVELGYVV